MRSFAILYHYSEDSVQNVRTDLHINLWDLKNTKGKRAEPCIDFGLKIDNFKNIDKIYFYFPFHFDKGEVMDLYNHIIDRDIAKLIFNDNNCEKISRETGNALKLSDETSERLVVRLDKYLGIDRNEIKDGKEPYTVITIDISKIKKDSIYKTYDNCYMRFRIQSQELKNILWLDTKLDNYFLESAFVSNQIIDMKINEVRNISSDFMEIQRTERLQFVEFHKIHFLLAEPASGSATFFGDNRVGCRTLEDEEWNTYLQNQYDTKDAIVYHIKKIREKEDEPISTFSCLIKSEMKETNWKVIGVYVLIMILISLFASALLECGIAPYMFKTP